MRVLIVEDNPGDLFLIEEILSKTSINFQEIVRAADLTSAQTLLLQNNPEVILLDLSLPDSQGVSTLRAITQLKPEGAIIILSGLHDQKLLLEALKEGAEDYLIKGETEAPPFRENHSLCGRAKSLPFAAHAFRGEIQKPF